jgi:hypothetical protein
VELEGYFADGGKLTLDRIFPGHPPPHLCRLIFRAPGLSQGSGDSTSPLGP